MIALKVMVLIGVDPQTKDVWEFVEANGEKLDAAMDYQRDLGYDYFGFKTLERSYLLRVNGKIVERPQHMRLGLQ